jgi:hypothetical protein
MHQMSHDYDMGVQPPTLPGRTARERAIRGMVRYAMKVECRGCGNAVFAHLDEAETYAKSITDKHGDLRGVMPRVCSACAHMDS